MSFQYYFMHRNEKIQERAFCHLQTIHMQLQTTKTAFRKIKEHNLNFDTNCLFQEKTGFFT